MPAELKSTSQGATLVLSISNPDRHNALSTDIVSAAIEALAVAERNPDVRSVILRGEGPWFCGGSEVGQPHPSADPQEVAQHLESLHSWIDALRVHPQPVVAAVEGAAWGAGLALALACDFIVAAQDAVFHARPHPALPSPEAGASWWLTRALPRQLVNEMLMCGRALSARDLHGQGVVNLLAEPGKALAAALDFSSRLHQTPPQALERLKELLLEAPEKTLSQQMAAEQRHLIHCLRRDTPHA